MTKDMEIEMGEWNLINEIPDDAKSTGSMKDHTWKMAKGVFVLCDSGDISVAYYDEYYAEGGSGYVEGQTGWVEPCSGDQLTIHYGQPTHWMPLPRKPKTEDME